MTPTLLRLATTLLAITLLAPAEHAQSPRSWTGTWATANMPMPIPANLPLGRQDVTLRQVVHISQGGKRVRVTFTNEFGSAPLHIAAAHLAFLSAGSKILKDTDRTLTFHGKGDLTLASGAIASSDALVGTIPIYSDLVISIHIPGQDMPVLTGHYVALATTFVAAGDQSSAEQFSDPAAITPGLQPPDLTPVAKAPLRGDKPARPIVQSSPATAGTVTSAGSSRSVLLAEATSWFFLKGIEVDRVRNSAAVVAFGDSITDGDRSTPETNRRYPDDLAALLGANKNTAAFSVLNTGISGNRILHDDFGPSALNRLNRDALEEPGAKYVILLEGINDLGRGPLEPEQIIGAMKTLVHRAHAKGIRILGGTLLPCGGSGYDHPGVDEAREKINQFIRVENAFDGVVDFDKALRDPQRPNRILPKYDSGDHLHPSDLGYAAMAAAVNPRLFRKQK